MGVNNAVIRIKKKNLVYVPKNSKRNSLIYKNMTHKCLREENNAVKKSKIVKYF